ncbi:MAG: circularly permuted type 2 ATP-grasp protein [Succinivibrio sp.]
MDELLKKSRDSVNSWLERYGVKFGIYKNGTFKEQIFPYDSIPRVISNSDWIKLEKGLIQRAKALNMFLYDIYHDKNIVKDSVVPPEFAYSSKGYMHECEGISPSKSIYAHIAGIDLVQAKSGEWIILEDNLRIPSGASYPMIARSVMRKVYPEIFSNQKIIDNRDYGDILKEMMDHVNVNGGLNIIFTPGRYNSAYFEHSYLAEKSGATLAYPGEIIVENDITYYLGLHGKKEKVGCIYRRISDEYMDPNAFEPDSLIGIPNILQSYKKGNVALVNALGNGVADDKGIYYFVPKMIRYYLNEEPILSNAPTYLPYYKEDYEYMLSNFEKLVIKDVSEAGGYGVVFGRDLDEQKLKEFKELVVKEPRRFIAQEVIDFKDLEIFDDESGQKVMRKADLRAFVVSGKTTKVWASGLTRFSRNPNSFVVNSSQGGGFKDTWIMAE